MDIRKIAYFIAFTLMQLPAYALTTLNGGVLDITTPVPQPGGILLLNNAVVAVASTGVLDITNGGISFGSADQARVNISGGTLNINNSGALFDLVEGNRIIMNSGEMNLTGNIIVRNMTVSGQSAGALSTQNLNVGSLTTNGIIGNFGRQYVNLGANTEDMLIASGGIQNVTGGNALRTTVGTGGILNVGSQTVAMPGSTATNTSVSGGVMNVWDGAVATNTSIHDGGVMNLRSGSNLGGDQNFVHHSGAMVFHTGFNAVPGTEVIFNSGRMRLGSGTNSINLSGIEFRGAGYIDFNLTSSGGAGPGNNSDHFTFDNIMGNFGLNFNFHTGDVAALNAIGSIDVIRNYSTDINAVTFTGGVDIGMYHWNVSTEDVGGVGVTTVARTDRVATIAENTVQHAFSVHNMVNQMSGSMHRRVGELQWLDGRDMTRYYGEVLTYTHVGSQIFLQGDGETVARTSGGADSGVWMRGIATQSEFSDGVDVTSNVFGVEFGYDYKILNTAANKIFIGALGYVASGENQIRSGNPNNDISELAAFGVGLYGIWLGRGGWFADVSYRQHFLSQDVQAWGASHAEATNFSTSHTASTLNMEFGRQILIPGRGEDMMWFITPSAQLSGMYITASDFTMGDTDGRINDWFSAQASAHVMGGPRWRGRNGSMTQIYLKTGYVQQIQESTSVNFGDLHIAQNFDMGGFEYGAGLNYRNPARRFLVYLDAQERVNSRFRERSGTAGLRYEF